MNRYVTPDVNQGTFTCPRCGTLAYQSKAELGAWDEYSKDTRFTRHDVIRRKCFGCDQWSTRIGGRLVDPVAVVGPPPHEMLTGQALDFYEQARAIAARSPRGAAAMLRLTLQVLVTELVPEERDLNRAIGILVDRGLHPDAQRAMDVLRVRGNHAAHPSDVDFEREPELLPALFVLVNTVVEQMISEPASLYEALPEGVRKQIERRDEPKELTTGES